MKSIAIRFFLLMLTVAVPLAGFDYYHASLEKKRWVVEVVSDLSVSSREVVSKVDDLIDASEDLLTGLSMADGVRGDDLVVCNELLRDVGRRFSKYTNFSLVNADRYIVCSSGPLPRPVDVSKSPNINEAFETRKLSISPFKFGVLTGKPILVFSLPIHDEQGGVKGTLNTGLSLTWLSAYLSEITKVEGEQMIVFDGRGTVLATHPHDLHPIGGTIAGTPLAEFAFGLDSNGGEGEIVSADGTEMLVAVSKLARVPGGAYIAATAPRKTAQANIDAALAERLGVLGGLLAASLIVGWIGLRFLMLNPLERVVATAGRMEAGDLSARSDVAYDGSELGQMAEAFDRMAEALQARAEALKESEANYRELVETGDQLVHSYRPDTTELFVNSAFLKFFGGKAEDWLGKKWMDFATTEQRRDINTLMRLCTPDDPEFVYEQMTKNVEGEERWLRWSNHAIFDADGNLTHFQAVGLDISDRKHAEAALERAMMDARNASQAKSNFLANMSHELRTPLNSIIGFSEMMSSEILGELPKSYHEYAGYITTSGHHLLNIINDLLDLSKIEAGVMNLEESELDLGSAVVEVSAMLQDLAAKNGNHLDAHLDGGEGGLRLKGDRLRIKQVLLNVASNALKFTSDGKVLIEAINPGDGVILRISDTGIGMSERDISIALSPFGQVDGHHLNKRFDGTGLGLPLAEQLMEMHGGKLEIDSEPGKGTTVTLRFPAARTVRPRA